MPLDPLLKYIDEYSDAPAWSIYKPQISELVKQAYDAGYKDNSVVATTYWRMFREQEERADLLEEELRKLKGPPRPTLRHRILHGLLGFIQGE